MKFSEDDILIIEIISTKFHKKIHSFTPSKWTVLKIVNLRTVLKRRTLYIYMYNVVYYIITNRGKMESGSLYLLVGGCTLVVIIVGGSSRCFMAGKSRTSLMFCESVKIKASLSIPKPQPYRMFHPMPLLHHLLIVDP